MASNSQINYFDDSKNQEIIKLDRLFIWNTSINILVCIAGKYAITNTSIKNHINQHHKNNYKKKQLDLLFKDISN